MQRRDFLKNIGKIAIVPAILALLPTQTQAEPISNHILNYKDIDKTQYFQLLMQLHDKQVISTQTLCEQFGLDYDTEAHRARLDRFVGEKL